jgi:hypothetical protein
MARLADHSLCEAEVSTESPRSITRSPLRHAAAIAPLMALIVLVACVFTIPSTNVQSDSPFEMLRVAQNLARDGSFSDPFIVLKTGPTAAEPPLYPLFLAFCIKVFRDGSLVLLICTLANILAGAITVVLLHSLIRPQLGAGVATFAAGLWLLSSWMGTAVNWVLWDAGFTPLLLVAFCRAILVRPRQSSFTESYLLPGTLLGAIFLLNPAALVIALLWCGHCVYMRQGSDRMPLHAAIRIVAVAAIIGAPWIVRNYAVWGRIIVRTNFGMTLFASNNSCAQPLLDENFTNHCYGQTHPNESLTEAQLLRRLGEPEYDRVKTAAAFDWIRANPRRFWELTAHRILFFWFPSMKQFPLQARATWIITLLSIPGLVWMWRHSARLAMFVTAAAALYPIVYYLVVSDIRYRAPLSWVAIIPAAYLCDQMYRTAKLRWGTRESV